MYCMKMPWAHIGPHDFRILWNGRAMFEWNAREDKREATINDPESIADMLILTGKEAAAARKVYGYEPDKIPERDELVKFLTYAATPADLNNAIVCLNTAINIGSSREYKEEDNTVDIDTLELKKN